MRPTTAYVSANQLTPKIPATAIATPGTAPVSVTNPSTPGGGQYGGGTADATSSTINFTVN